MAALRERKLVDEHVLQLLLTLPFFYSLSRFVSDISVLLHRTGNWSAKCDEPCCAIDDNLPKHVQGAPGLANKVLAAVQALPSDTYLDDPGTLSSEGFLRASTVITALRRLFQKEGINVSDKDAS